MNYLRKTVWSVGLILLLELLKTVLDRTFAQATVFHHNFLTCLQLIILLWAIISILSGLIFSGKNAARNIVILFLLLAIPELLFTYWLHHPSRIPSFLIPTFRYYYGGVQRNIIQFNPDCSVYDS